MAKNEPRPELWQVRCQEAGEAGGRGRAGRRRHRGSGPSRLPEAGSARPGAWFPRRGGTIGAASFRAAHAGGGAEEEVEVKPEFDGQVAVVTGAASGIGRAIAALFLRRGARVAILDIDEVGLEAALRMLDGGERLLGVCTDVSDSSALREARRRVLERFAKVDILVNNTGIYPYLSLPEMSAEEWDRVFAVNTRSVMLATQNFMADMVARRFGRVVCIVTEDAYVAKPQLAHYAASKAAVASLVKSFALELAPHGVFVNGVSPGAVATGRAKKMDWFAPRVAQIPCGYAAEPEDIAEVVLFLASRRNRYIVGETVLANGGTAMI